MRTIRTPENREAFLDALSETANVTAACERVGISRRAIYEWREEDPDFVAAWERALNLGTDALEDEAVRRGREGTVKPVFYKGEECGGVREYSDTLLIFMLKARRPEKFRDSAMAMPSEAGVRVIGGLPDGDSDTTADPSSGTG
jgi:hypothetical protein